MEDEERREVIVEFLDEASAGQPVAPCVDEILDRHAQLQAAAAEKEKEEKTRALNAARRELSCTGAPV